MSKFANISIEKPFFTINTYTIYVIFDPPHLLKNIRNNHWKYINNFYDFDINNNVIFAPKLMDDQIYLPFNKKMKVNLAAKVVSDTLAAGI